MELRLALRRLRQRPAATTVSIATLACAIGVVTAAWWVLGAVFFHPIAVGQPGTLRVVAGAAPGMPVASEGFTYPKAIAIRDSQIFQEAVAYGLLSAAIEAGGARQTGTIKYVSADYFDVLGVPPAMGRGFAPGEDQRGVQPVIVLSDRFWRESLSGDRTVIGRTLKIGATSATIVGVAPRAFRGLTLDNPPAVYMPLAAVEQVAPRGMNYFADPMPGFSPSAWVHVAVRVPAGEDGQREAARLSAVLGRPATAAPLQLLAAEIAALPAESRPDLSTFARLLTMTTGLLLVIGSLTVGTLLLVRTEGRRNEFAVRLALGGTRARLAAGVALEGALLAVAGCALAWPIAAFLLKAVRTFELPGHLMIAQFDLRLDQSALATAAAAALLAAAAITSLAVIFSLTTSAADLRHARAGATPRVTRRGARSILVVAQVAAAMVLLVGAGLFARSLAAALTLNPTIDAARTVTTSLNLTSRYWPEARSEAYFADLIEELSRVPSVEAIGSTMNGIAMGGGGQLTVDGAPIPLGLRVDYLAIDAGYLPALGLRVTAGRNFTEDDDERAAPVALVSASLAERLADPQGRVLGRHFAEARPGRTDEIVGIVPDVVTEVRRTKPLLVYQPIAQQPHLPFRTLLIRAPNPRVAIRDTAAVLRAHDPALVPRPIQTINQGLLTQMAPQRFGVTILGGLGGVAVLLTMLGAYVLAEAMSSGRRREMGIRAALGASRRQLGAIVFAETARLVGVGLIVGLGLVWLGASTVRALLFQTAPLDPATLTAVAATMLIIAFAVSMRPALHAARMDVAKALRDD